MIIDFTVSNFRSIKTPQVFSMHVNNPKHYLADNVAYPAGDKVGVLRSAGVYGANASGKSNFLKAFRALRFVACLSGNLMDGQPIRCYEPFLLSAETAEAPVQFELEFVTGEGMRYRYSIKFTGSRILEEVLEFYPSRVKATIFSRQSEDDWESIHFGGLYKGKARRLPFFKNNSYLSKAGNSAGSSEVISAAYNYIRENLVAHEINDDVFAPIYNDEATLNLAAKLLCNVDTGIDAIEQRDADSSAKHILPEGLPAALRDSLLARTKKDYFFSHKMQGGTEFATFRRDLESEGTRRLFSMLPFLISTFRKGMVLIVDELDASLHPHIAELLIKLFNDSETNVNNAQLIFSTHSMNLMSPQLMRRDQIWFVEKKLGSSELYCLDQYEKRTVKSSSPFSEWYDEGRFGALPNINYGAISKLLRTDNESSKLKDVRSEQ